ncbi:unnamed protein product [Rhizophagus irregularis]|nr:unnamed protein product [Rhizophagus irregularis]
MIRQQHNFRPYFTLIKNPNNYTNALAVCNYCITKHGGIGAAQIKPECYTVNRTRLCRSHLAKCSNFREYVDDDEVQEILALSVPEDNKKKRKELNKDDKNDDSTEENNFSKRRRLSTSSSITQLSSFSHQSSIINFYRRSLSTSELSLFEILLLRLIVSNVGEYAAARRQLRRKYPSKIFLPFTPGDTRWNSYYFCFHSILKSKSALKFLSAKFNDS